MTLALEIEEFFATPSDALNRHRALQAFNEFKFFLNRGEIRAADRVGDTWQVHVWVKKGILLGMRLGTPAEVTLNAQVRYIETTTFPLRHLSVDDGVMVPAGGSAIRDGAFVGRGVLCSPPMYIEAGAYVDAGTSVGSHSLVGSCTQVGKNVHIGPGTLIEGMLEPIDALPVIIEEDVYLAGAAWVQGSVIIRHGAVIGPGVMLSGGAALYDAAFERTSAPTGDGPLVIPPNAVVVQGQRQVGQSRAAAAGVTQTVPVIVQYREPGRTASAVLKDVMR
jgi:2,3,4,5-tetrahydropyridine-2,6-dicarboxylate N-succinyltransferase